MNSKESYRTIFKATSIFGGVQVFNILIQLIRSKVIAVLLGPAGMGVIGLLNSTISLVTSVSNFGLGTSAVRDISEANASGNKEKVQETVSIFRTLVWGTGILGMVLMLILAPLLSQLTFGSEEYTVPFRLLAVTLLLAQLTAGQTAVLQGLRKIQWLAKASVLSGALGLIATLPLYYFFGIKGIVPALIGTALIVFVVQSFYAQKVGVQTKLLPFRKALQSGKPMLQLGFMLSLSGLITVAASYIVRIFIAKFGDIAEVGLYNAGFSIVGVYVGMVFTAMSTDYFPRLSGVNSDSKKYNPLINQQSETAILLLSPLICGFLIFINWGVIILYSEQFLPITEMILYSVLGIYFKALSWPMGYLTLAKGDSKSFFWNELIANFYILVFNCIGYYIDGLRGLGISYVLGNIVLFVQIYFFVKWKYGFAYSKEVPSILLLQIPLGMSCFLLYYFTEGWIMYTLGSILIFISAGISLYRMNKTMNVLEFIKSKIKK